MVCLALRIPANQTVPPPCAPNPGVLRSTLPIATTRDGYAISDVLGSAKPRSTSSKRPRAVVEPKTGDHCRREGTDRRQRWRVRRLARAKQLDRAARPEETLSEDPATWHD